jgi:indole-3-acetate monooxygenase
MPAKGWRMENRDREPVARARGLAAAIAAAADAAENSRRIPEPLLAQLHQARLFRMLLPHSAGGEETAPGAYLATIEELARHDASVAWNVFVANSAALIAAYLEPDVARTIFGASSTIVAWGPPNGSRASAVAGGYRVSGSWDFASGCRHANWMGAHFHVAEPPTARRPCARAPRLHQRHSRRDRGCRFRVQGYRHRCDRPGRAL